MTLSHLNLMGAVGRGTRTVKHLVPERVAHEDGIGSAIDVGAAASYSF